jgi:hypothetical protein
MSIASPLILSPYGIEPPPFINLVVFNLICAWFLMLCLVFILTLRVRITTQWPLVAILSTLGGAAITLGVSIYFAHIATTIVPTLPAHPNPLGEISITSPYAAAFKLLYICTAIIILATIVQAITTLFMLLHRPRPQKTALT